MCLKNWILAEFLILSFYMTKASLRQENLILLRCCPEAKLAVWACISHYLIITEELGLTGDNHLDLNLLRSFIISFLPYILP